MRMWLCVVFGLGACGPAPDSELGAEGSSGGNADETETDSALPDEPQEDACDPDTVDRERDEILVCELQTPAVVDAFVDPEVWVGDFSGMAAVIDGRLLVARTVRERVSGGWYRHAELSFVSLEAPEEGPTQWRLPDECLVEALLETPSGLLALAPPYHSDFEGALFRLEADGTHNPVLPLRYTTVVGSLDILARHPIQVLDAGDLLVQAEVPECPGARPVRISAAGDWESFPFFAPAFTMTGDTLVGLSFIRGPSECEHHCPSPIEAIRLSRFDPQTGTAERISDVCATQHSYPLEWPAVAVVGSTSNGFVVVDSGALANVGFDGRRTDFAATGSDVWGASLRGDRVAVMTARVDQHAVGVVDLDGGPIQLLASFDPGLDARVEVMTDDAVFVSRRDETDGGSRSLFRLRLPD